MSTPAVKTALKILPFMHQSVRFNILSNFDRAIYFRTNQLNLFQKNILPLRPQMQTPQIWVIALKLN